MCDQNKLTMKNLILKTLITLFAATGSIVAFAQTNPKSGYIITLQNDTIRGTIDYLTEKKSERVCKFCKHGENSFVNYSPDDIKAYRADNNEFYYVAKTVDVEGKSVKLFAGYLVKGGMSLYRFLIGGKDYYLLEGENGETAQILDASVVNNTADVMQTTIRHNMASVSRVFTAHPQELNRFKTSSFNANDLSDIVINYNNTYCRDLGDCVQYSLGTDGTERSIKASILAGAGVLYNSYKLSTFDGNNSTSGQTICPALHVGVNFDFPRLSRFLFAQAKAQVSIVNYNFSGKYKFDDVDETETSVKSSQLDVMLGLGYRLLDPSTHKFVPFVHAGVDINRWLGKTMDRDVVQRSGENAYSLSTKSENSSLHGEGFYIGAGLFLPLGNHQMEFSVDYRYINSSAIILKSNFLSLTASYIF